MMSQTEEQVASMRVGVEEAQTEQLVSAAMSDLRHQCAAVDIVDYQRQLVRHLRNKHKALIL